MAENGGYARVRNTNMPASAIPSHLTQPLHTNVYPIHTYVQTTHVYCCNVITLHAYLLELVIL